MTSSVTQGKLELDFLPKFCVDHFEAPQRAVHLCSVDQLPPWEDVPTHPGGYILWAAIPIQITDVKFMNLYIGEEGDFKKILQATFQTVSPKDALVIEIA